MYIFDKGTRIHNTEKIVPSINATGKIGYPHAKEKKLDIYVIPFIYQK
jgi:hypothetical protein